MDPTRSFSFVIMNADKEIASMRMANNGHPQVLEYQQKSGSDSLPMKIFNDVGQDCSKEYKVVEYFFEVDGDKVFPVAPHEVGDKLANDEKQSSACSEVSKWTNNGEFQQLKSCCTMTEEFNCNKSSFGNAVNHLASCSFNADTDDAKISSSQLGETAQVTFNLAAASSKGCSPVEKTRRMEIRVEDFRLANAKKDSCINKMSAIGTESIILSGLPAADHLAGKDCERLSVLTRSQCNSTHLDAITSPMLQRNKRFKRDGSATKETEVNRRQGSTGSFLPNCSELKSEGKFNDGCTLQEQSKFTLDANCKSSNFGNSSASDQEKSLLKVHVVELEASERSRRSQKRQRRHQGIHNSKRMRGVVAEHDAQSFTNMDCLTEHETKINDCSLEGANDGRTKSEMQPLLMDNGTMVVAELSQNNSLESAKEEGRCKDSRLSELEKSDESLKQKFGENVASLGSLEGCGKNSDSNLHSGSTEPLLQTGHKVKLRNQNIFGQELDERSESSYDVLLFPELSTDGPDSKSTSHVDDGSKLQHTEDCKGKAQRTVRTHRESYETILQNTKQSMMKMVQKLLAECLLMSDGNLHGKRFLEVGDNSLIVSDGDDRSVARQHSIRLESIQQNEKEKALALEKEFLVRNQVVKSKMVDIQAHMVLLQELENSYNKKLAESSFEMSKVSQDRLEMIEKCRKLTAEKYRLKKIRLNIKCTSQKKLSTVGTKHGRNVPAKALEKFKSQLAKMKPVMKKISCSDCLEFLGPVPATDAIVSEVTSRPSCPKDERPRHSAASLSRSKTKFSISASIPSSSVKEISSLALFKSDKFTKSLLDAGSSSFQTSQSTSLPSDVNNITNHSSDVAIPSVSKGEVQPSSKVEASVAVTEVAGLPFLSSKSYLLPLASNGETCRPSSSSVVEILPSSLLPKTESYPMSTPSKDETCLHISAAKVDNHSHSLLPPSKIELPSSTTTPSKSTPSRISSHSCSFMSPLKSLNGQLDFPNSVCMLPSVMLVPVTTPYIPQSRCDPVSTIDQEKTAKPVTSVKPETSAKRSRSRARK